MRPEFQQRCLEHRRQQADAVLAEPHLYKVCDQCRSISFRTCGLCPICHGYRWDESREALIETAKTIGTTPFPLTAGTVPKFGKEPLKYFNNMNNKEEHEQKQKTTETY
jgi:hypothetical protein